MKKLGLFALLTFVVPFFAHAAVRVNEVAWMGTATNANAEWIELSNSDANPVNLSGWRLTSLGTLTIKLSGTIAAGGYYLLERTNANNIAGVTADQIYTGALTNSGATLALYDLASTSVDTVVGGINWSNIGGDNKTKNTAQRTNTGWITALPTPRAVNASAPVQPPAPKASSKQAKVDLSRKIAPPAVHGTQESVAPAAATSVAAAGASIPASREPATHSLLTSPWVLGFGGLLVISAVALIVL